MSASALRRIAALCGQGPAAARLRGWADTLDRAPESRRPALLAAIGEVEPALAHLGTGRSQLLGAVPYRASAGVVARLVLGESPQEISGGLTRAEAHRWLSESPTETPEQWLLGQLADCPELARSSVRSVAVARWLIACWRDPARRAALERPREEILAGRRVAGSYLERVDELQARDLRPSVEETYRRAGERLRKSLERALQSRGEALAPEPRWWSAWQRSRPTQRTTAARLLRTGPDLVAEGRALQHCVATYASAVQRRESVIVGLCVVGERSTVELAPDTLRVRQHRARCNREPSALSRRALEVLRRRWCAAKGVEP